MVCYNSLMYTFIGGTQVAGKSYSSKKFVENSGLNITLIKTDALRLEMINDPKLRKWINVFWDRDEHEFWQNTFSTFFQPRCAPRPYGPFLQLYRLQNGQIPVCYQ